MRVAARQVMLEAKIIEGAAEGRLCGNHAAFGQDDYSRPAGGILSPEMGVDPFFVANVTIDQFLKGVALRRSVWLGRCSLRGSRSQPSRRSTPAIR